jgi:hypothetical membrane protein
MELRGSRLAVALAPVACVSFVALYATAASQDPEYTFLENYLSDLGVGPGAWAFNSALMVTGVMLSLFAVFGLIPSLPPERLARMSGALLALAGMFLVNVGIFTEDAGDTHLVLSYAFFLTVLASLGMLVAAMYREKPLGPVAFYLTSGSAVIGLGMLLVLGANPFTETVAVMIALAWGLMVPSIILWRGAGSPPTTPVSVP